MPIEESRERLGIIAVSSHFGHKIFTVPDPQRVEHEYEVDQKD